MTKIANFLTIKSSNCTIQVAIKVNFVKSMSCLEKMPTIRLLLGLSVLMESIVHLRTTSHRFQFSWLINCRKIYNFIFMLIRQFGVLILLTIIDLFVFMPIIFKTLEEIQNSITTSLYNVNSGKKMKI